MVDIHPFRGLRYGPRAKGGLAELLAPPYDIINPQEQQALHQQSPHNVVRLELGMTSPRDTAEDNRYTRARSYLETWLREGVLVREDQPALYLCQHRFEYSGVEQARWELLVRVRLEEWEKGVVIPHEHTLPDPKVDRLNLLRATKTNISPIYALYRDAGDALRTLCQEQAASAPIVQVPRWREASFALWAIADSRLILAVQRLLAEARLYIADGHHRYETALAYRREQRLAQPEGDGKEGFNFVFMSLTSLSDPGLLVLPIHRLVKGLRQGHVDRLAQYLSAEWVMEHWPLRREALEQDVRQLTECLTQDGVKSPTVGLYGLEPGKALVLRPRSPQALYQRLPQDWPEALRKLDLTLLHRIVLHGYLGIGQEAHQIEASLGFTHRAREAIAQVDAGAYQLAFLVNPTRVEQMVEVAEAGEKMPQKSTFFYPKLPTGLVLCPLDDVSAP